MRAMRKFFSPWKALVAAIAVFASAGSAKADLVFMLNAGSGESSGAISVANGSAGDLNVGGFLIGYKIHETTAAAGSGAPPGVHVVRTFSVELNVTNPAEFGNSIGTLTATLTGTNLYGPANGPGYLVAGVHVTDLINPESGTAAFFSKATYGVNPHAVSTQTSVVSGPTSLPVYSSAKPITISNPYQVTSSTTELSIDQGGSFKLTSTTQVYGVPEPSGIAAALAGVPCLGLLLGTIRRRLTGSPAPTV